MPERIAPLSRFHPFRDLREDELARVAAAARREQYPKGQFLLLEGQACTAVQFIARGRVKVHKISPEGREQVLHLLGPGDALNLVPAFDERPNPASAEALTDVEVYSLSRADFVRLVREIPQVAANVLADLAEKLRLLVDLVEDLSFRTVSARLARFLLTTAADLPGRRWTQEEIATHLGTVREMVGRVLRGWQEEGLIQIERGRIVVQDRAEIEQRAEV